MGFMLATRLETDRVGRAELNRRIRDTAQDEGDEYAKVFSKIS